CTVVPLRLLALTAAMSPAVATASLQYLLPPVVVGGVILATRLFRPETPGTQQPVARSPLNLVASVRLALLLAATLAVVEWVTQRTGDRGILLTASLLGLTDTDALTVSMARHGGAAGSVALAAQAIAVGLISNTVFKLGLALGLGAPSYRRYAGVGLGLMGLAVGVGWLVK